MIEENDPVWRAIDLLGRSYLSAAEELELAELLEKYRLDEKPAPLARGALLQASAA